MSKVQPSRTTYCSAADLQRLAAGDCRPVAATSCLRLAGNTLPIVSQHRPLAAVRGALTAGRAGIAAATSTAALRETLAATFAGAGLVVDAGSVAVAVRRFEAARELPALRTAAADLLQQVEASHQTLLANSATVAIQRAAVAAGYPRVEVRRVNAAVTRVFAEDATGAGITTEIRNERGAIALQSEVTGLEEQRCAAALQRFNAEVDAQGLRLERGPVTATHGRPTTAAVRDRQREKAARTLARPGARPRPRQQQRG